MGLKHGFGLVILSEMSLLPGLAKQFSHKFTSQWIQLRKEPLGIRYKLQQKPSLMHNTSSRKLSRNAETLKR